MGNNQSTNSPKKDENDIYNIVNHIASNYIFTSNFTDMQNLNDVNYCNNLVILTSRIIEENLNDLDIEYLAQHIKDGKIVDLMTKDKVIFLKKDNIPKLDVKNNTQKRRLCVGIAKFYVKVAHIFACIMKTINPTISYSDNAGETKEVDITEKHMLPNKDDLKQRSSMKMNMSSVSLCSKRLDALINNNKYETNNIDKDIVVNPNYCDFNSGNNDNLQTEPGMVELEQLYNDKYNYDTGGYNGMTDKMKKQYERDLKLFYEAFSDNIEPFDPKVIKKFSDIKLRDHNNKEGCSRSNNGEYLQKYKGTYKDDLFFKYAEHIKTMMENTKKNQDKLLSIIDRLFVFVNIEDESNKITKMIMINPELTEKSLQTVVEETRNIIINLYITCEKDFLKGLEIFEGIVEKQISNTTMERINNLPLHREVLRTQEKEREEENRLEEEKKRKEKEESEKKENRDEEEETDSDDKKSNNLMDMFGFNKDASDEVIQKPSDDIQKPSDDIQKPPDDKQRSSDDIQKPSDDIQKPPDDKQRSSDDIQKPPDDIQKPPDDIQKPMDDKQNPPLEMQKPSDDDDVQKPSDNVRQPFMNMFKNEPKREDESNDIKDTFIKQNPVVMKDNER